MHSAATMFVGTILRCKSDDNTWIHIQSELIRHRRLFSPYPHLCGWLLSCSQTVVIFWPKYRSTHLETYLFSLSKRMFPGSKYPKNIYFNFEKRSTAAKSLSQLAPILSTIGEFWEMKGYGCFWPVLPFQHIHVLKMYIYIEYIRDT